MRPADIGPFLARTTPRLLVAVFTVMVLLFVATGFLTRAYRQEKRRRAAQHHQMGQRLMEQGHYDEAIEMFTAAATLQRGEAAYREALALALFAADRNAEAETYLQQLIADDPAHGLANLTLAHIYLEGGDGERAMQHYQRAIYGRWNEDPTARRIEVRFELISFLEGKGAFREMEAELLRLLDDIPDGDTEMKKRVGRLFLSAGSYDTAAKIFTEVTEQDPRDAEAFAGLGDAEFEMAHYFSARTAYRQALRLNPDDLQSKTQYDLATEIIRLNPMLRGLGSATRLGRSRVLVERSLDALAYCSPEDPDTLPENVQDMIERAEQVVAGRASQRSDNAVDENIALAESLRTYQENNCASPTVPDRALELVLEQLSN